MMATAGPPPPEPLKDYRCSFCTKTFGRAEHRRRHELIHNENRPFRCQNCPKDFVRRDALQRHELTHQAAPNLLQRGGRACTQCASAKARCSGDVPCSRCRDRATPCTFPNVANSHGEDDEQRANTTMNPDNTIGNPVMPISFTPAPVQGNEQLADTGLMGFDFWDQNVLSATNWLDALDPSAFAYPLSEPFLSPFGNSAGGGAVGIHSSPNDRNRSHVHTDSPQSILSSRSAAVTEGHTSHTSYDGPPEVGQYYVDGEPARLPRVKRRKISQSQRSHGQLSQVESTSFEGFSLQMKPLSAGAEWGSFNTSSQTYSAVVESYQRLCITPSTGCMAYEPVEFPSLDILNHLLGLFQRNFSPTLPFLHPVGFEQLECHEGMVLAMAAIGTHYLEDPGSARLIRSIHEFVRRYLVNQEEAISEDSLSENWTSIELLHLVATAYCGDGKLHRHAVNSRHRLSAIFARSRQLISSLRSTVEKSQVEIEWAQWIRLEKAIRLAYSAWMVDCMFQYHFQSSAVLSLKDAQLPLPCEDKLWNATTEQDWKEQKKASQTPTLNEALQSLYIEKHMPKERGEFARILIIHGLYHRMWEVEKHLSNPLAHWEPTAKRQTVSDVLPSQPIWLPSVPTFTKWQNSACDCLDVLHWQANATIGKASGLEHPTVLHLHLARVVLLAPHAEITNLAKAMTSATADRDNDEMLSNKRLIQRWAIQHQYKARLAIIHAGVVFWHVRRYSVDGFYEAPAVALAALTLWAFGTFSNKKALSRATSRQPQVRDAREESDQSDDASCNIILLDRPADDEIVQQFIRNGYKMKAHVAGSDLYASKGPERALRQGCKLLSSLRCWDVSSTWNRLLQTLIDGLQKNASKG